jgi:long-chain acyl-CoA synthetase
LNTVSLSDVFIGLARRWGDRTALVSPRLCLSYSELIARSARTAHELRSRGVVEGSRVGISIRDGAETVVMMIAIWMLGATAVPIDFRTNSEERALLSSEFDLLAIIEDRQKGAANYDSILVDTEWTELIADHNSHPICPTGERGPAVITLTSGTTARPIGIVLDHEAMLLRSICDLSLPYGETLLNPLPISYSASRSHTFSALLLGSSVFFHPALFSPQELAESIRARRATSVCAVPTILRNLLNLYRERSNPQFFKLDALYSLGAPLLPEEKLRVRTVLTKNFVEDYGTSLAGRISSLSGSDLEKRPETVGRVMPYVSLQVVDSSDEVLPVGEAGIIRVRAPGMARAVCGESTRASGDKLHGGWAYPGDIGAIDDQGFIHLLGRTSDLIIRSSVNVHPSEVEVVIAAHKAVQEVAVVGFTKFPEGQEIAAFVVPSGNLTEAELLAYCRSSLSPDKRPRKFVFMNELPRNRNGKISREALRIQIETVDEMVRDKHVPSHT